MDQVIVELSTKIIAVLLPFVTKGAEEFASKVGDAAYEKAKMLLTILKQKWSGDKEASESLALFEKKPQRYQVVLEDILQEKLVEDHDLASQTAQLLQEMGPSLDIVMQMDEGEDVTGFELEEMKSGNVHISQNIARGKHIKGAVVKNFG